MSDLTHRDFAAFFRAVWGNDVDPFPWQQDLLTLLATGKDPRRGLSREPGLWPAVLDLPTGSGKTAALDIALFHLALEAAKREGRRAPVRIAFVVDRRLIVDDAHARAERLAEALAWSLLDADEAATLETDLVETRRPHLVEVLRRIRAEPIVQRVAARLGTLAGAGQPPLIARRLRGGVPREDDWARTPVQPTILCSTVDQVGSRLLFRGYGVSDTMKPIHAGLLGSDCLILLDEAHLAEPFRQTLEAVERLRGGDRERAPFGFAVLTATPAPDEAQKQGWFGLSEADEAHPILARRMAAGKPARLVDISKQGVDGEARRAEEAARETVAMLTKLRDLGVEQPAVGVILNRVARARATFERLAAELGDAADIMLLIGPARSIDRDDLARDLEPIRTRRLDAPRQLPKPLIVVATQTIEAGVDIDFDGLVTEAAALDALRQRFGRLNRAGRRIAARATILAHKEDLAAKADDPVYGDRIKATWNALKELAKGVDEVDFGIQALHARIGAQTASDLSTPTKNAPVLMPAYAHLWSQTAPIPNADPDVALFLHGPDRSPASVQIVWRADIDEQHDLRPAMGEGADAETARNRLVELLKLVPPRAAEAIEVPLWATRAWLDQPRAAQASFSDAADRPEPESDAGPVTARRAFLWAGEGGARTGPVYGRALRDGDLIVVPVGYGGCDPWGWKPASTAPVNDVADKAAWPYRARRFAVRVTPELARLELLRKESDDGNLDAGTLPERLGKILADHRDESPQRLLEAILALGLPPEIARRLDMLSDPRRRARKGRPGRLEARFVYGDVAGTPRGVVFIAPFGIDTTAAIADLSAAPSTESEDAGAAAPEPLGLAAHAEHVRAWASAFVAAGLTAPMAEDVAVAALLHDAGKADRRYQAYYAGGDPYGQASEPLAKTGERRLPRGAWERAGLPPRWRHEALSVRLARGHRELQLAHDPLLVLWLIGTHHGYGRPLFPHADPTEDREPGPQSLAFDLDGLDWVRIFDVLKEKYGIWGLARLEAFVRLADHRASEAGAPPGEIGEHREAAE